MVFKVYTEELHGLTIVAKSEQEARDLLFRDKDLRLRLEDREPTLEDMIEHQRRLSVEFQGDFIRLYLKLKGMEYDEEEGELKFYNVINKTKIYDECDFTTRAVICETSESNAIYTAMHTFYWGCQPCNCELEVTQLVKECGVIISEGVFA